MPPRKSTKPRIKREPTVIQPMDMAVVAPEPVDEMDQAALDAAIAAADKEAADSGTKEKYYESVGRRKESVARVRLYTKKSTDNAEGDQALITVNGKSYQDYFLDGNLLIRIEAPLRKLKSINRFKAVVQAHGGGISGQADAVRHGIARALEKFDGNFRKKLKKAGFLTRDARAKERRKYGLKKARKAPQWSKR